MAKLEPFDGCVRGRSNDHRAPMKADQQDLEGGDQDADDGNANGNSGAGLAIGIKADAGKNRPDRRCGQHVICQSRHQGPVDIDRFGVTPHQLTIIVPKSVLLPRGLFRIVEVASAALSADGRESARTVSPLHPWPRRRAVETASRRVQTCNAEAQMAINWAVRKTSAGHERRPRGYRFAQVLRSRTCTCRTHESIRSASWSQ